MMEEEKKLTEEQKAKEFIDAYKVLVEQHGYQLAPEITTVRTNHGTFELGAHLIVAKVQQDNTT